MHEIVCGGIFNGVDEGQGATALRTGGQVNLDLDLDGAEAFVSALDG